MERRVITIFDHYEMLHTKTHRIEDTGDDTKKLVDEMFDIMYETNGIGLAAVQIGVLKRIFVADIPNILDEPIVCINPEIVQYSVGKKTAREGCLSVPGYEFDVTRPSQIVMEYSDLEGLRKRITADGLLSSCLQHEYDHLDGIVYLDRLHEKYHKLVNKVFVKDGRDPYFSV